MNTTLLHRHIDSPVGPLLLVADDQALRVIEFDNPRHPYKRSPDWQPGDNAVMREAARQLAQYFHGERRAFDLPLAPQGTDFQRTVWHTLADIPYGQTISYAELARRVDKPTATRAVGAANGRNPLPIVLPCHRVIGSALDSLVAPEHSDALHEQLTRALREACDQARRDGRRHVLCSMDLDRFKIVNDGAGHAAGDALLRDVANLLRRHSRGRDLVARLGGDEFAMLLRDCSVDDGVTIARQFIRAVAELRFTWDDKAYQIGASVGLTAVTADGTRADELLSQADVACYTAKTAGRSQVSVYGGDGSAAQRHRREIQVAAGIRVSPGDLGLHRGSGARHARSSRPAVRGIAARGQHAGQRRRGPTLQSPDATM